MTQSTTPPLDAGLVFVEQPDRAALQRLVRGAEREGETLWVDAGGVAETYGLLDEGANRRELRGIRIARAFQAHQHHQLVRDLVGEASARTALVVAPNLAALYEAADGPSTETERLFDGSLALLADLADALDVPVLVSAPHGTDAHRAAIRERAADVIECRRTSQGYAFETDEFETTAYWHRGWWQTTIPYWVDLYGAVDGEPAAAETAPATLREVAIE
ncbi:hypothetical protein [Haloarcula salinisoli]|uniref:Rad51 protein n=1 Tax=Haloarcula salinisoli TaxID=2487746 RepID=A0A8J7YGC5_9EURY|nr:hypothetical protein [Halomicroarcula salinisoli]MBX0285983.1 hypothetical protein [Halomicroarcula salinisoli]MBX0302529.1 hypothetical protein [Halomicroarcula salinisoli]